MENFRLKVFRAVVAHLNFTRAAEELLLTQPAVTQQIKALEDECGVPLFDRTGGRIVLTESGQALLPYANRLKHLSDEASEAVANASGKHGGLLALGASQTIAYYILPKLVAGFIRENPRVKVTAKSGITDEILQELVDHKIQLALIEGPAVRKDLHVEPFMEDEVVLAVPASHEWADNSIPVSALQDAPLLMRENGSGSRRSIENALVHAGIKRKDIKIKMELDSTEGLLSAAEEGLGVTFVSRWAVRNHLALGTLKLAHVQNLHVSKMFSIAYPTGPEPTGNSAAFRSYLLFEAMAWTPGIARKPASKPIGHQ
jgi:LysR family transcriptional regulator, transcriptional activator of the cysJI operon